MAHDLEAPPGAEQGTWDALYLSRGNSVSGTRPVFTGDAFLNEGDQREAVMLLQHPCALRTDGVSLAERLLVARVSASPLVDAAGWKGSYKKMPLPGLCLDGQGEGHAAASFIELDVVASADLPVARRISTMSQVGVNLLLQRWVHHNSRVVVPTAQFQLVTSGPFEEADLTEEWCDEAVDQGECLSVALREAHAWMRAEGSPGTSRQRMLEDPQHRSAIRKEMRQCLREKYAG